MTDGTSASMLPTQPSMLPAQQRTPKDWLGQQLGGYQINEILGVGEKGLVLKAHDASIERNVAIKILTEDLASDETERTRFLAEANRAGQFNHAHPVTSHEIAQQGDLSYIVMEIVSGGSTQDYLDTNGAYSVSDATKIIIDASKGLAAAHQAGFVHRDIKPANLLLTEDGIVKVSDFRLAKQTSSQAALKLTLAGQVIGTPHFMSPEQCEFDEVDARSDIYSMGATYYSLLTGKRPYEEKKNDAQVMLAHVGAEPPDARSVNPDVPDACAQIIEQAMAKDPEQRYASLDEMREDLEAVLESFSWECG
mgnify:FL=1